MIISAISYQTSVSGIIAQESNIERKYGKLAAKDQNRSQHWTRYHWRSFKSKELIYLNEMIGKNR